MALQWAAQKPLKHGLWFAMDFDAHSDAIIATMTASITGAHLLQARIYYGGYESISAAFINMIFANAMLLLLI